MEQKGKSNVDKKGKAYVEHANEVKESSSNENDEQKQAEGSKNRKKESTDEWIEASFGKQLNEKGELISQQVNMEKQLAELHKQMIDPSGEETIVNTHLLDPKDAS
ncbi:hypothetical protein K7X08_016744 [Anisodus acutangulus]|uniref:Uncharacterized protein n=1 Tax=Anisodus acutangulus TaxID=402998 RepID=A0A9Q1R5P8_9SOLA|nr:hypothetical protein K7X08_016744 [Anisodus acutangulus]